MKSYVELVFDDGNIAVVEVETREQNGDSDVVKTAVSPKVIARRVQISFEQVMGNIRSVAQSFTSHLTSIPASIDEAQIEFGLTLDASTDVILTKAGIEANFRVLLTWKRQSGEHG